MCDKCAKSLFGTKKTTFVMMSTPRNVQNENFFMKKFQDVKWSQPLGPHVQDALSVLSKHQVVLPADLLWQRDPPTFLGVPCVMKPGCGLTILMMNAIGYWMLSETGQCTVCETRYDKLGIPLDPIMRLGAMHQRLKRGLIIPPEWRNPGLKPESVLP